VLSKARKATEYAISFSQHNLTPTTPNPSNREDSAWVSHKHCTLIFDLLSALIRTRSEGWNIWRLFSPQTKALIGDTFHERRNNLPLATPDGRVSMLNPTMFMLMAHKGTLIVQDPRSLEIMRMFIKDKNRLQIYALTMKYGAYMILAVGFYEFKTDGTDLLHLDAKPPFKVLTLVTGFIKVVGPNCNTQEQGTLPEGWKEFLQS